MALDGLRGARLVRGARITVVVTIVCYAALLLFVQVNERVVRRRAERLLSEMRAIEVGGSTWQDLHGIQTRWGAYGHSEGECVPKQCEYLVEVNDLARMPGVLRFVPWWALRAFAFLGHSHLPEATLRVHVDDGVIRKATYGLMTHVPKGYGPRWEREEPQGDGYVPYSSGSYELIARASSHSPIEHLCCYWPESVPHPEYTLWKPGGCENCLAIFADFEPQAKPATKERLMNFNFSCFTRWTPCASEEDIMPDVGREYIESRGTDRSREERLEKCAYSVSELAEASLDAAVVRVRAIQTRNAHMPTLIEARLVRHLGSRTDWKADTARWLDVATGGVTPAPLARSLASGEPLIVLFGDVRENAIEAYPCGLIAFSDENAKVVSAGLALGKGRPAYEY
jgi:hypothetical protein